MTCPAAKRDGAAPAGRASAEELPDDLDDERVVFRKARKLRVDSRPKMWFNADGEIVGNEPSTFEILPKALRVIVGPDSVS